MIYHFLDIGEKDFGDPPIGPEYFDGGPAERLSAAKIIDAPAHAFPFVGDDLYVIAIEHSL
jgi:hypothetical protein